MAWKFFSLMRLAKVSICRCTLSEKKRLFSAMASERSTLLSTVSGTFTSKPFRSHLRQESVSEYSSLFSKPSSNAFSMNFLRMSRWVPSLRVRKKR